HTLIVTVCGERLIREYTRKGELLRGIPLDDDSIRNLQHSIQLSTGGFAVCYIGGDSPYDVAMVDIDEHVIHSYECYNGSSAIQLNRPCHLAVDRYDNVLVSD